MKQFSLGLIEGFYGRQWSWSDRRAVATFLAARGYRYYIYAPKGDAALRKAWHQPFDAEWLHELRQLSQHCQNLGLGFGVGLSPMGLQMRYAEDDRRVLGERLQELQSLELTALWILFDDMRGDKSGLAANQSAVVLDVGDSFDGELAVCPSYYTSDPVLDQVFGQRPDHYLEDLAAGLPEAVDILWTGSKVISDSLDRSDCEPFSSRTGRKPLLWDNYPVNDGGNTADFLHLNAFENRSPELAEVAAGHFCNPMNQAHLSLLPLATLPQLYAQHENSELRRLEAFRSLPEDFARLLERDWQSFQFEGLKVLSEARREQLGREYGAIEHPAAREICDWLAGEYVFDPDCLTG